MCDKVRCEGCGQKYLPSPDPATEEEVKLCPDCLIPQPDDVRGMDE